MVKVFQTTAVLILQQVVEKKRSLTDVLEKMRKRDVQDFALIQEIAYGTLRWLLRLECIAQHLIPKPIQKKDNVVYWLLLVGLYQLLFMRAPPYAVVSNLVAAARGLKQPWAAAFINAVLRNFLRKRDVLQKQWMTQDNFVYSHPSWLKQVIEQAWGTKAPTILEANNQYPPMILRVNTRKLSVTNYLAQLGTPAKRTRYSPQGIILESPCPVEELPLFQDGVVSVQDESGQLAAPLLMLAPQLRVLDACAAPGGKSFHLLELEPLIRLTCLDKDPLRLKRLADNLTRTKQQNAAITLKAAQVQDLKIWWDGELFDRILLDAPCSATGVIRRHPDIKWLRKATDLPNLVALQAQLLETLWPLLKPGGLFLYTTCSILPEENALQLRSFFARHLDAQELPIETSWGISTYPGKQILPGGDHNMDGFYYGRVIKCLRSHISGAQSAPEIKKY